MKNWSKSLFSPATDKGHRVRLWGASIIAGMLLVTLAFTSGVLAAPHDVPTVFYACVNNSSGTIHMTTMDATCPNNEMKISWNQVGPQGPAGPQGPPGPNKILTQQTVTSMSSVSAGNVASVTAQCLNSVLGGGYSVIESAPSDRFQVIIDAPDTGNDQQWRVEIKNISTSGSITFTAYASCLSLT